MAKKTTRRTARTASKKRTTRTARPSAKKKKKTARRATTRKTTKKVTRKAPVRKAARTGARKTAKKAARKTTRKTISRVKRKPAARKTRAATKKTARAPRAATTRTATRKKAPKAVAKKAPPVASVNTGRGPGPGEIGGDLVSMFNAGELAQIESRWWSPRIVSIEGGEVAMAFSGRTSVQAKNDGWKQTHVMHGASAEGPYVGATGFSVKFRIDVEDTTTGQRTEMEEVGVYTVHNGKIVQEEFMYGPSRPADLSPTRASASHAIDLPAPLVPEPKPEPGSEPISPPPEAALANKEDPPF